MEGACRAPGVAYSDAVDEEDAFWHPRLAEPGVHGIFGLHLAGGPGVPVLLSSSTVGEPVGGLVFSARGGILVDRFEATLEVGLDVVHIDLNPLFQASGNAGYYLPLYASADTDLSWPLRVGAGYVGGQGLDAAFQLRADLIGIAFNRGPLLLEAHLPSFRFISDFDESRAGGFSFMQWVIGASGSYVF